MVQITFDPAVISYEDILFVFWRTHDPTTLNRQGNVQQMVYSVMPFDITKTVQIFKMTGLWLLSQCPSTTL